jgi:hypothetical protein
LVQRRDVRRDFQRLAGTHAAALVEHVPQDRPGELDAVVLAVLADGRRYFVSPVDPGPIRYGQQGIVFARLNVAKRARPPGRSGRRRTTEPVRCRRASRPST